MLDSKTFKGVSSIFSTSDLTGSRSSIARAQPLRASIYECTKSMALFSGEVIDQKPSSKLELTKEEAATGERRWRVLRWHCFHVQQVQSLLRNQLVIFWRFKKRFQYPLTWIKFCPRYTERLARYIEDMGGAQYIKDDVADHKNWSDRLGCKRIRHSTEVEDITEDVEMKLDRCVLFM
ncbi:hypothetical protein LXL04_026065 [Taraxacum kok-saghyz]